MDGGITRLAKVTVRQIYTEAGNIEADGIRKATADWARKSEKAAQITAMIKLAESEPAVPVATVQLDSNAFLLNVENGTLDLHTGTLRPHRREDLITKQSPVTYDPGAKCPRWLTFLNEVFALHPDLPEAVQRMAGYSLTADTREECLFLLHGSGGRNGKGTLLKILGHVIGEYAGTADFSAFVSSHDDRGPRDDIANMRGKRFIVAQETREGAALVESLIKWLTGGDIVRARRLYENSYEFEPQMKLWLATNHKPVIRGADSAIWSRIKLIPFAVSFEGREDRGLKSALLNELRGILTWAVEGCLRWQEKGLALPESVTKATADYRADSDRLGRFIEDCCVRGDGFTALSRAIYSSYRKWAEDAGEAAVTETTFGLRLKERGFAKEHTRRGAAYGGIGLRAL